MENHQASLADKIYTMSGDLVKTLHYTIGSSEEAWNQMTEFNQLIYADVYLCAVESDRGNFMVARASTEEEPAYYKIQEA